ncbi:hypothetical protein CIL05_05725 [Virgibacillus profundi]|uniref:N-acetyltransferase domain-containing protein n=1 Tax=Virgibacillus profundi TaxID=2024555 RepID=A0A2A2IHH2_9BACI|nr:GNAT family N-acetyltransferase [Virgibacillus profundi]PAV30600.1 hypothetical protein CIL05_05725 [Virgibacillus profundi]PXY54772.1 N-acetyltransferase [Virgibacillus profundi]
MFKIREATMEDYIKLQEITNDKSNIHIKMESTLEKKELEEFIRSKNNRVYIVEDSGDPVAFIQFQLNEDNIISIERFSIEKNYKKKGIDEHLYSKLDRFANGQGITQMVVYIDAEDHTVYDFFERKGWKQGQQENIYYLK